MPETDIFYLIKAKKSSIALMVLVFVIVGLGLSLLQSLKYSSNLRLLVVQRAGVNVDPYAMSKSNEYLGQLLSKVAYANTFYNKVLETDSGIDRNYFGVDIKTQSKNWEKSLDVRNVKETGIINIKAYHTNREQAERLAKAVALTIMTQHGNYHGMGDSVMIRLLDEPTTSNYPDQPNLLLNLLISMIAGLAFGIALVYLRSGNQQQLQSSHSQLSEKTRDLYQDAYLTDESLSHNQTPTEAVSDAQLDYHEHNRMTEPNTNRYPWQTNIHD